MAAIFTFHLSFLLVTILSNSLADGFTVELIRRYSPKSPFYDPNKTPAKGLNKFFPDSVNPADTQAQVTAYKGQHLMKVSIGTPPQDIYCEADSGSDLFWAQCLPCKGCYKQVNPMFDPKKSSTYRELSCQSEQCQLAGGGTCSSSSSTVCSYSYSYGDGSISEGVMSKEKFTLISSSGESASVDVVFGCGHKNTGTFNDHEMGLVGLGGGPASLVSQIGPTVGGKKLSFCFLPFGTDPSVSSKISFGKGSEVVGAGVVSTPLVSKGEISFYYVTLEGISVGKTNVPFTSSGKVSKGNIFIDSGTPPLFLPKDFYGRLVAEVKRQVTLSAVADDPELGEQLCYKTGTNFKAPILTAHFEGGDVQLNPINTFIPTKEGVSCFGAYLDNDYVIYGNYAQANYLIGVDLEKKTVSFKPTDCTKY